MDKKMDLKATYNKIAAQWHKDHQQDTWWVDGVNKFVSSLAHGGVVLDAGCGAGTKSRYLIGKGLNVMGIDFSKRMIEIAQREVPEGKFLTMDIRDAQKLKRTFEGIFLEAVLLHIPKKEIVGILRSLRDVLKPTGYLYAAVKEKRPNGPEEEVKAENDYGYRYERFFSYFTLDEMKKHMKEAGFSVCYENVTVSGTTHWIEIIGQKIQKVSDDRKS